jgi:hypothetical protein
MSCLSLTDLFLIGLALDLSGAFLLAKGLLISPARMNELTETVFGGGMAPAAEEGHFENRIDAEIGVIYLGVGFGLQVLGYMLDIAGVHSATGTGRLIVGAALAVGTLGLAWLAWSVLRPLQLRRLQDQVIEDFESQ